MQLELPAKDSAARHDTAETRSGAEMQFGEGAGAFGCGNSNSIIHIVTLLQSVKFFVLIASDQRDFA